jgi:hypothetical protein
MRGYKEATVMKREDGVEFIFHTLLPPSVNLDLYNIHLEQEQKRTMNDYVWGFGFSEDYTPFFVGKRPISIASVYHGMEDLSSFKIHGFTQRDTKSLGLDFHDCAYHIPIEMNIQRGELSFLGFMAEAVHTFSQKLFHVFQDPIQKSRYQKIFSTYLDAIADREIFAASAGGRLLDKRVDLKHLSQKVNRHPLVKNAKEPVPRIDRLVVCFHHLPRNLTVDPSRFFAKATEMHPTQGAPSVAFHFCFIPK